MADRTLEELSASECLNLLGQRHLGRVAFIDQVGVLPMIVPVNYLLHAGSVVFRTDAGSKLSAALRGAPVAFETDGVDEVQKTGWSVVLRGHAEEVTEEEQLAALRLEPLLPWAPGAKKHYVRVNASLVSGRRISLADVPSNWWG